MKHHPRSTARALAAGALAISTICAALACPASVFVPPSDPHVQYMGHWDIQPSAATTNNSGSSILFGFTGQHLSAQLAPTALTPQHRGEIYVSIDDAAPTRYIRDESTQIDLTPTPLSPGQHTVEIVVKDVDEHNNRWNPPLASSIVFQGFLLDDGAVPVQGVSKWLHWSPGALKMEFYGDSITQGVRALSITAEPSGNDATRGYAHLVGLAFDARFNQIGYGSQGITRSGGGNVPPAGSSFGFNFGGSPADPAFIPDIVVVNQGTNDGAAPSATFVPLYTTFMQEIRARYPNAWIFAMRPFNGAHAADISGVVSALNDPRLVYVDTTGWLLSNSIDYTETGAGLHPNETGHAKAARLLIPIIARTALNESPPQVGASAVPNVLNLRAGLGGLVTVVLAIPDGYTMVDVRGDGARALSGALSSDGHSYVATFLKSDLTNVPAGNPVDFNITGTLRQGGAAVPFATGVPVRILK